MYISHNSTKQQQNISISISITIAISAGVLSALCRPASWVNDVRSPGAVGTCRPSPLAPPIHPDRTLRGGEGKGDSPRPVFEIDH